MVWQDIRELAAGTLLGTSGWKHVGQERIDRFATATDDFQFVHVDRERAAAETPFAGTIAHGFLTLSMISSLASEVLPATEAVKAAMLISVDKVKFLTPVREGKRIRAAFHLGHVSWLGPARAAVKVKVTMEIEGERRPALTCEVCWLVELREAVQARNTMSGLLERT